MRRASLIVIVGLPLVACESFRPVEAPADQIQLRILSEGFLERGDEVRLVTRDGTVHEFRVTGVDVAQGTLTGKKDAVQVTDIVSLEKRVFSPLKTGFLVGGLVIGLLGTDCEDDCNEYGGVLCCS